MKNFCFTKKTVTCVIFAVLALSNFATLSAVNSRSPEVNRGAAIGAVVGVALTNLVIDPLCIGGGFVSAEAIGFLIAWGIATKKVIDEKKKNQLPTIPFVATPQMQQTVEMYLKKQVIDLLVCIFKKETINKLFGAAHQKIMVTKAFLTEFKKSSIEGLYFMFKNTEFCKKVTIPLLIGFGLAGAAIGGVIGITLSTIIGLLFGFFVGGRIALKWANKKKEEQVNESNPLKENEISQKTLILQEKQEKIKSDITEKCKDLTQKLSNLKEEYKKETLKKIRKIVVQCKTVVISKLQPDVQEELLKIPGVESNSGFLFINEKK